MKTLRILILVIASTLLGACGAAGGGTPPAQKVEAAQVAFTGVIESMDGTQWVVDGQTITVDPLVAADTAFVVGDTVKVEAVVAVDGSVSAIRVEMPGQQETVISPSATASTSLPGGLGASAPGGFAVNDNSNSNTNSNINGNTNDNNSNDDNSNDDNSNDDDEDDDEDDDD